MLEFKVLNEIDLFLRQLRKVDPLAHALPDVINPRGLQRQYAGNVPPGISRLPQPHANA